MCSMSRRKNFIETIEAVLGVVVHCNGMADLDEYVPNNPLSKFMISIAKKSTVIIVKKSIKINSKSWGLFSKKMQISNTWDFPFTLQKTIIFSLRVQLFYKNLPELLRFSSSEAVSSQFLTKD